MKVRAKKSEVKSSKRVKDMVSRDKANSTTFVVVGGGEFDQLHIVLNLFLSISCFTSVLDEWDL